MSMIIAYFYPPKVWYDNPLKIISEKCNVVYHYVVSYNFIFINSKVFLVAFLKSSLLPVVLYWVVM